MTRCDICDAAIADFPTRRVAVTPRPSDPMELVAIMYGCGCPDTRDWPKASDVYEEVIETGQFEGSPFVFVTL